MIKALYIFATIIICFFSSCHAQVPDEVQRAFEKHYPNENDPKWMIDKNGNFETHFKEDGEHYRADFTPGGQWIETERSIKKKDLPKIVREILKSEYNDFEIVELEETLHHSKGLFYDVELKKDGKKRDVEFRADGHVIN